MSELTDEQLRKNRHWNVVEREDAAAEIAALRARVAQLEEALCKISTACRKDTSLSPTDSLLEFVVGVIDAALARPAEGGATWLGKDMMAAEQEALLAQSGHALPAPGGAQASDILRVLGEEAALERQLNELLHFQNALIEAAEMPSDLSPEQVLPWFIERLDMADVGDYESAMRPAREAAFTQARAEGIARGTADERGRAAEIAESYKHAIEETDPPDLLKVIKYSNATCALIAAAIREAKL